MKFEELNLAPSLMEGLSTMNFQEMTPIQELSIPKILEGKDVIACAQTGTGKTAAYLLPLLHKMMTEPQESDAVKAIIMAPTRELAQQIDQQLEGFSYFLSVSSVAVYGGNDASAWEQQKHALQSGADFVIATPGRLISHISLENADFSKVKYFVLDEADRMLDMGFYDDIISIVKQLPKERQTIMFSATMPPKIQQLAENILHEPELVSVAISKPAEGITQQAYICHETQKLLLLVDLLKSEDTNKTIIFSSAKLKVREIARQLNRKGFEVAEIHSDLEQAERDQALLDFKNGKVKALVATDIVSRGIDVDDIDTVINFDVPRDVEDYIHRIGRTARANRTGKGVTFVSIEDQERFCRVEKFLEKTIEKMPLPEELGEGPVYEYDWQKGNMGRNRRPNNNRQGDRNNGRTNNRQNGRNNGRNNEGEAQANDRQNKRNRTDNPNRPPRNPQKRANYDSTNENSVEADEQQVIGTDKQQEVQTNNRPNNQQGNRPNHRSRRPNIENGSDENVNTNANANLQEEGGVESNMSGSTENPAQNSNENNREPRRNDRNGSRRPFNRERRNIIQENGESEMNGESHETSKEENSSKPKGFIIASMRFDETPEVREKRPQERRWKNRREGQKEDRNDSRNENRNDNRNERNNQNGRERNQVDGQRTDQENDRREGRRNNRWENRSGERNKGENRDQDRDAGQRNNPNRRQNGGNRWSNNEDRRNPLLPQNDSEDSNDLRSDNSFRRNNWKQATQQQQNLTGNKPQRRNNNFQNNSQNGGKSQTDRANISKKNVDKSVADEKKKGFSWRSLLRPFGRKK